MSLKPTKILRERNIEDYLKDVVKTAGGEVRKVKWIGRSGAPDRLVMFPGQSVWVELKRPKKDATAAQGREHARMRKAGNFVVVINTRAEVDDLIKAIAPRSYNESGMEMVVGTPKEIGQRMFEIDRRDAGIAYENLLDEARRGTVFVEEYKKKMKDENTVDITPSKLVDKTV